MELAGNWVLLDRQLKNYVYMESTDIFAFYYRRYFDGGGDGRIWLGCRARRRPRRRRNPRADGKELGTGEPVQLSYSQARQRHGAGNSRNHGVLPSIWSSMSATPPDANAIIRIVRC